MVLFSDKWKMQHLYIKKCFSKANGGRSSPRNPLGYATELRH